jgi:hypothetical protein
MLMTPLLKYVGIAAIVGLAGASLSAGAWWGGPGG